MIILSVDYLASMECSLCKRMIEKYDPYLNHLKLDESRSVDICQSCIYKFLKWQQGVFAKLFPTKAAKRWVK
jgi:hypothetical protein